MSYRRAFRVHVPEEKLEEVKSQWLQVFDENLFFDMDYGFVVENGRVEDEYYDSAPLSWKMIPSNVFERIPASPVVDKVVYVNESDTSGKRIKEIYKPEDGGFRKIGEETERVPGGRMANRKYR